MKATEADQPCGLPRPCPCCGGRMLIIDETGDENQHLFVVDPVKRAVRDLTPIANVNVQLSMWSLDAPGDVAVKINDRDVRWHDLYRIDLATGQRTLIWENTQELAVIGLDWQLRPRHARSNAPDGGSRRRLTINLWLMV